MTIREMLLADEDQEKRERFEKLRAAFEKAEESGCEDYPCGDGYFIIGSELKKEAEDWGEEDEFFEEYGSIDALDDDGIYLWITGVFGPYYSFGSYIRQMDSELAGFLED